MVFVFFYDMWCLYFCVGVVVRGGGLFLEWFGIWGCCRGGIKV